MFKLKDVRQSYKKNFIFNVVIKLKKLHLHLTKSSRLSFEFHSKNNYLSSNQPLILEEHEYQKRLQEKVIFPVQLGYDIRKKRFFNYEIEIDLVLQHQTFHKKIGVAKIRVSQILNSKLKYSNEEVKFEGCPDKNSKLELSISFEYVSQNMEIDSQDQSFFSLTSDSHEQPPVPSMFDFKEIPDFLLEQRPNSPARSMKSKSPSRSRIEKKSFNQLPSKGVKNYTNHINQIKRQLLKKVN